MVAIYFNGFETGDASEIVSLGSGASVQSATVRTGAYALKQANAETLIVTGLLEPVIPSYGFRFGFRKPTNPSGDTAIVRYRDSANVLILELNLTSSGKMKLSAVGGFSATEGTIVLSNSVWYEIKIGYSPGSIGKVTIDNVLDIDTTHGAGGNFIDNIALLGAATPNEYFFDDTYLQFGTLVAPSGGCIARSPITGGTPTYDQWTKSTGSDAGALWNDTPFSATDSCVSPGTGDPLAQTAQVGNFDITQSGHGVEVIKAADTINSCTVAIMAKRSAGGGRTHKIRRRL